MKDAFAKHRRWLLPLMVALLLFPVLGQAQQASQNVVVYAYSDQVLLHFDPADIYSVNIVWFNVYERLLRYYPADNRFEPMLATSYEKSADGLTWTFHIRQGVTFHTGNPLNAQAVKACIERTISRGQGESSIWDVVSSIEVSDQYTVVFHLTQPVDFRIVVSSMAGALIYDPSESHDWYTAGHDSGTGPYEFVSHQGLESATIKKFDGYWGGWKGHEFDAVIFKQVPEDSTRLLMLQTGQADFTNRLAFEMLKTVKSDSKLAVVEGPTWQGTLFYLNTLKAPLDNVWVRRALAYTIPYDDIIQGAFFGYAAMPHGLVMQSMWASSKDIFSYSYNPTVAKALLAAAGYQNGGFRLTLTYNQGDQQEQRAAELWKEKLAALNIDLQIQAMPWDAQIGLAHDPDPSNRQDIFLMYAWPITGSTIQMLQEEIGTADPPLLNVSYYSNKVVDNLLADANNLAGVDSAGAAAIVQAVERVVMQNAPVIPFADLELVAVKQASLQGPDSAFDNPAYPRVVDWYHLQRK